MEDLGDPVNIRGQESGGVTKSMIDCRSVSFSYPGDTFQLEVPELSIPSGEQVAIVGPSGAGKTTLINLIAGIQPPENGDIIVDGISISRYSARDRADFRISRLGLIFQEFELLEYLTVIDNVLLPYRINPILRLSPEDKIRAMGLCELAGIASHAHKYPAHLSQGERQRVAVCRALITEPSVIIGDEPTANLDPENRDKILQMLFEYCHRSGATMVMVTHDEAVIARFGRTVDVRSFAR